MATLLCVCSREMDCPREVLIWNYFDHEHVVGTHYKLYNSARVIAEKDNWCLVLRHYKLPLINVRASSLGFMWLENPRQIRSIQYGRFSALLDQTIHLEDLSPERCLVTSEYRMEVPAFFKLFAPLFSRVIRRWFDDTWAEDAPMRVRRWKLWKLGFKDFEGLPYVNEGKAAPASAFRPYPIEVPVPKSTSITAGGLERPFSESTEVGY